MNDYYAMSTNRPKMRVVPTPSGPNSDTYNECVSNIRIWKQNIKDCEEKLRARGDIGLDDFANNIDFGGRRRRHKTRRRKSQKKSKSRRRRRSRI